MKLFRKLSFVLVIFSLISGSAFAAENRSEDTLSYELDQTILVTAKTFNRFQTDFPFEKDRFIENLATNNFQLIRKGSFFAQDIYADGFRRGDINVTVDGEHYHSACPNRMDSPLTRVNSLEMASITFSKNSSGGYNGLGGSVSYHREQPIMPLLIRSGYSYSAGAMENSDFAFLANDRNHRITGRYATGKGYDDAEGRSFVDLYGYKEDYSFKLAEVALMGANKNIDYRLAFTYTDNVMFPYLMMDERLNRVYNGYVKYLDYKLYFNYTDHLMDNNLRVSPMFMETAVTNLTVGLNGSFFDVYYRNWDSDNIFVTPMLTLKNHLMPDVHELNAVSFYQKDLEHLSAWGKIGMRYLSAEDSSLTLHRTLYPEADNNVAHMLASAGIARFWKMKNGLNFSATLDMSLEPPETETQFISVKKPMNKPAWVGNPELDSPLRIGVRTESNYKNFGLELFANHVWNYVNLTARMVESQPYQTYDNIDAVLLGFNLYGNSKYYDFTLSYTWANNTTLDTALSEIAPLTFIGKLKAPAFKKIHSFVRLTYNDAQTNVDETIGETATGSWARLDLGLDYRIKDYKLSLEIENLTDELYTRHLSYQRNPYASGARVYEPGRTLRLSLYYDKLF